MRLQVYVPLLCCCVMVASQDSPHNVTNSSTSDIDTASNKPKRGVLDVATVDLTKWSPLETKPASKTSSQTISSDLNNWSLSADPVSSSDTNPLSSSPKVSSQTASASLNNWSYANPDTSHLSSAASTINFAPSPFFGTIPQVNNFPLQSTKQPQAVATQQSSNFATVIPLSHTFGVQQSYPNLYNFASLPTYFGPASQTSSNSQEQVRQPSASTAQPQASASQPSTQTTQQHIPNNHQQQQQQQLELFNFGSLPLQSYSNIGSPILGQTSTGGYQFLKTNPSQNAALLGQPSTSSIQPQSSDTNNNFANIFSGTNTWPFLQTSGSQYFGSSAQQPLSYNPGQQYGTGQFLGQQYGTGQFLGFPNSGGYLAQNQLQQPNNNQQLYPQRQKTQLANYGGGSQQNINTPSTVKQAPQVTENPEKSTPNHHISPTKPPQQPTHYESDDDGDNHSAPVTDHHKERGYSSQDSYKPASSDDSSSSGYTKPSGDNYNEDDDESEPSGNYKTSSYSKPSSSQHNDDDDEEEETKPSGYYKKPYSSYNKPSPNNYNDDESKPYNYYKTSSSSYTKPPTSYKTSSYSKPRYSNHRYEDEETKPSNHYRPSSYSSYPKPSGNHYREDDEDSDQHESSESSGSSHKNCNTYKTPYYGAESQQSEDEIPQGAENFDNLKFEFSQSFDHLRDDILGSPSGEHKESSHPYRQQYGSSSNSRSKTLHKYPYRPPTYTTDSPVSYFSRSDTIPEKDDDSEGKSSDIAPITTKIERQNRQRKSYDWSYVQHEIFSGDPEEQQ